MKKCLDCGKKLYRKRSTRCKSCSKKGKLHSQYGTGGVGHHNYKNGKLKCIDCGERTSGYDHERCKKCFIEFYRGKNHYLYGKGGKKHHCWRGGISREPYGWDFDEALRELIRKRDNYKCQVCGVPQEECFVKLCCHHIDYDKENNNPINLISLCRVCHTKTNYNREYWEEYFKEKIICLKK